MTEDIVDGFLKEASLRSRAMRGLVKARRGWEAVSGYKRPSDLLRELEMDRYTSAASRGIPQDSGLVPFVSLFDTIKGLRRKP